MNRLLKLPSRLGPRALCHATLPGLAIALVLALLLPTPTRAFAVFGDTLDLGQRDFRIWNNFTDPEANDNLALDPDFPGAQGAALAIWKGVAEWGSAPHGTGTTDPSQPVIGSGASNFDAFFSGYSEGPGNRNANVLSMIEGSSFIKAYTEIPIRDGWRIRFYEDPWVWNDGPDTLLLGGSKALDLQGVATHEYGHALGLDHSSDPTATMFASSANGAIDFRSIEADDIAGIQFLYGVRSPSKALITGYTLVSGGQVLIEGRGFAATDNEVWFTHRAKITGPDGDPVRVTGVPSTQGGSRILVTLPDDFGPGDIAVRRPGIRPEDLSNASPFDPRRDALSPPQSYGQGKLTSIGTTPTLTALTLPSATAGTFRLELRDALGSFGLLLESENRAATPFQGGTLYLAAPLRRVQPVSIQFGLASIDVDAPADLIGRSRYYQVWFHDPGDPLGSGLSNGVRVTFLP